MITKYNPQYKKLMKTTASMNERAELYYTVKQFLELTFYQRYTIGSRMNLCDAADINRNEDSLNEYIMRRVVHDKRVPELKEKIKDVLYDYSGCD